MRIENDPKLDFRDVLIRPKRSTLGSRAHVDVNRTFRFAHTGKDWTGFPLIAANMDVVGTMAMARALLKHGAMVALHKHYDVDDLVAFFREPEAANAFYSLGTTEADHDKLKAVHAPRADHARSASTSPMATPRNSSTRSRRRARPSPMPRSWPAMSSPAT